MPTTSCSLPQTSVIIVLAVAIIPDNAPVRNLLGRDDVDSYCKCQSELAY